MRNPRTKRLAFEAGEEKHRAMSNESHHRLESFVDGACVLIHRSRQEDGGRGEGRGHQYKAPHKAFGRDHAWWLEDVCGWCGERGAVFGMCFYALHVTTPHAYQNKAR